MGRITGTRLHHSNHIVVATVVLLVSLVLCVQVSAQTGPTFHTYSQGVSLISIPFDYSTDSSTDNGNPCTIFGLASMSPLSTEFDFMTWLVGGFHHYPNMPADALKLGVGYFMYSPYTARSVTAGDDVVALEVTKPDPFVINLYTGWNLIGVPYHGVDKTYSVRLYGNAVGVMVGDTRYSFGDAVSAGIIKAGMWSYIGGRYELSYSLDEWKGYWIKAMQSCQLVISRSESAVSRGAGPSVAARSGAADIWSQQIVARTGAAASDSIQFGVGSDASDGYDALLDVEKPPAVTAQPYVYLSFAHPEWNANAGSYGVDIRPYGGRKTWEFAVESDVRNNDILLTWPGIANLPKDVSINLVDVESGLSRSMRSSSGYQFRMRQGTSARRFRVETVPGGQGVLRISGLSMGSSRGNSRTICCSLSSGASVDVAIKSTVGSRVVRSVAKGVTRAFGLNQFVWDCRNDEGNPVPAGMYLCEVRATGDDGQVANAVAVLTVAR